MPNPFVCAYYFPNWHPDERNDIWHGKGWTEWQVLKCALPRFPGHQQPKVPLWGYEDEADPQVMRRKIAAALTHGVDGFIFDWYWFEDGAYRIRCLDEGFLSAPNNKNMKFAVMWANHDAVQTHPGSRLFRRPPICSGVISPKTFVAATEHCINHYFNKENYLRLDGGLYFSIYHIKPLIEGLGGIEATAELLADFRRRVKQAGLGNLNINVITSGIQEKSPATVDALLEKLGIDSRATYGWSKEGARFPFHDYREWAIDSMKRYQAYVRNYRLPFYPTVCMGWDVSPRSVQSEVYDNVGYPFMPIISGTPEEFAKALMCARDFILSEEGAGQMLTINAWNEWTEGSYLEPDMIDGYGYLTAIKQVFRPE